MRDVTAEPLDPLLLREWAATLDGPVILPEDAAFDAARQVWNRGIARRPAAILRCGGTDDIVRAIEFATTRGLTMAVRSGGHSQAGHGTCDGGLVLDVGGLRSVEVDVAGRIARVASGARVIDVMAATQPHGLVTPMGGCPSVGVGGLTLGGGENFLMGRHGAVCDNLLSADIVTADGRVLTASAGEHADLFWAIRGGSGNFGVVTSLSYRLYAIGEVLSGQLMFPVSRAADTMRRYRDLMRSIPDDLETSGGLTWVSGEPVFFVAICFCGDRAAGDRFVDAWRTALDPQDDTIKWGPYSGELDVPAAPSVGTGLFLPRLDEEVIDAFASAVADAPPQANAVWNDFHGAVTRVAADETAFPLRNQGFDTFISVPWEGAEARRRATDWMDRLAGALRPFGHGVYVNNLNEHEGSRVREAYAGNYDRLARVKRRYDPLNVWHVNHNIPPADEI
jgi:FAD/FMN-containing dehydrogenase